MPDPASVTIVCDDEPFTRFEAVGADAIRIDTTVDNRRFRIVTGYRAGRRAERERPDVDLFASRSAAPHAQPPHAARIQDAAGIAMAAAGGTCPCCV